MPKKEKVNRIDAQWQAFQSSWGRKDHEGERKMVYDTLGDDENIEGLLGCIWGPEEAFEGVSPSFLQRSSQFDGIVLATSRRVLFVKKKGFSKIVSEMPLRRIETVEHGDPGLAEVAITGVCGGNWMGVGNKPGANSLRTYKLRNARGSEARRFIDFVRDHLSTPP